MEKIAAKLHSNWPTAPENPPQFVNSAVESDLREDETKKSNKKSKAPHRKIIQ